VIETFVHNLLLTPAAGGGANGQLITMVPIVLMFVVFYFLLIRPQQKQQKQRLEMLKSLQKGDKVITNSGIYGTLTELNERTVRVKIAENVIVRMSRAGIAGKTQAEDDK
jgi:preprotein translocase subunit YajC